MVAADKAAALVIALVRRTAGWNINPAGSRRISADGAIKARGRVTRAGKTVKARPAVRLPAALAGERVTAEIQASDRRGARQLERHATTIHVLP